MILEAIKVDFCRIAIDQHGTRALQVLLDECIKKGKTTVRTEKLLIEGIEKGRVDELMCNIRGNHVLKQCLKLLSKQTEASYRCIYLPVLERFCQVAKDKNGCQVVQECIKTASSE